MVKEFPLYNVHHLITNTVHDLDKQLSIATYFPIILHSIHFVMCQVNLYIRAKVRGWASGEKVNTAMRSAKCALLWRCKENEIGLELF